MNHRKNVVFSILGAIVLLLVVIFIVFSCATTKTYYELYNGSVSKTITDRFYTNKTQTEVHGVQFDFGEYKHVTVYNEKLYSYFKDRIGEEVKIYIPCQQTLRPSGKMYFLQDYVKIESGEETFTLHYRRLWEDIIENVS